MSKLSSEKKEKPSFRILQLLENIRTYSNIIADSKKELKELGYEAEIYS